MSSISSLDSGICRSIDQAGYGSRTRAVGDAEDPMRGDSWTPHSESVSVWDLRRVSWDAVE